MVATPLRPATADSQHLVAPTVPGVADKLLRHLTMVLLAVAIRLRGRRPTTSTHSTLTTLPQPTVATLRPSSSMAHRRVVVPSTVSHLTAMASLHQRMAMDSHHQHMAMVRHHHRKATRATLLTNSTDKDRPAIHRNNCLGRINRLYCVAWV